VGIGTSSPSETLAVESISNNAILLNSPANRYNAVGFQSAGVDKWWMGRADTDIIAGDAFFIGADAGNATDAGGTNAKLVIDSTGNVLVGKTATAVSSVGIEVRNNGLLVATRDSNKAALLNRQTTDGDILEFRKDGTTVGSIGVALSDNLYLSGVDAGLGCGTGAIYPATTIGQPSDNDTDLGTSSTRFDDIYATNGTIQTSDRNEKQDIAELSGAEQRVAVACKGLLRKFRWKDSVAEKGDDARIHFGIIAQDLQAAFAAEGLDAGDYAMFISTTWTDEETNEEKTRMGVRYSELLAFIIAAL
jgi:hypothetical protein